MFILTTPAMSPSKSPALSSGFSLGIRKAPIKAALNRMIKTLRLFILVFLVNRLDYCLFRLLFLFFWNLKFQIGSIYMGNSLVDMFYSSRRYRIDIYRFLFTIFSLKPMSIGITQLFWLFLDILSMLRNN